MKNKSNIKMFIATILSAIVLFSFSGCAKIDETGYFKYQVHMGHEPGIREVSIIGLTELGSQQKTLAIPSHVDGYIVSHIGSLDGNGDKIWSKNENLEKLFISSGNVNPKTFNNCVNLKKIIITGADGGFVNNENYKCDSMVYVSKSYHDKYYQNNEKIKSANVSYYGISPNGYFLKWCDDVEYGELIEYKYLSEVLEYCWYKEPECINKWDFNTDRLPEAQFDDDENVIYQETKLYWGLIKINN